METHSKITADVATLLDMGFPPDKAFQALQDAKGDVVAAALLLADPEPESPVLAAQQRPAEGSHAHAWRAPEGSPRCCPSSTLKKACEAFP